MNKELMEALDDAGVEVEDTLDRLMGDEELYLEYLYQFPENQNIIKLKEAVAARDTDTAMKEVHTLKGVALNLGMLPLVDVCMFMLMDFRDGRSDEALAQMQEIEDKFTEFKKLIEENR